MKLQHAGLIAAPILGVLAYVTYLHLESPKEATEGASIVSARHFASAVTIERGTAANVVDLSALQAEVDSLRAEVLALRHQMARRVDSLPARADSQPAPDVRSDPNMRAEAARERRAEMEAVDAAYRRQAVDPTWSANTVSTIREVLNSEQLEGIQADNIDCRSAGCRVELHDDGSGRLGKTLPLFAQQLSGTMPTITANTIPQGNGSSTVVLYMSRDAGGGQQAR